MCVDGRAPFSHSGTSDLLTDPRTFSTLGLSEVRLAALEANGWTSPTPIQAQAIPPAMEGKDVVGIAQTGTGKTGAFMIPALETLKPGEGLQVLVLCPTRELAQQVKEETDLLTRGTAVRATAIYGGVAYGPQLEALDRGDEVVVATPGRLIDLMNRGKAKLGKVDFLILDEADKMLDMGFRPQIDDVVRGLKGRPRTMLFSATMPNGVHDLALRMTKDAVWVEVTPSGTKAEGIEEICYSVRPDKKQDLLLHLLEQPGWDQVLVFTRTKAGADSLKRRLDKSNISCDVIHSDRQMKHRTQAIENFSEGSVRVLVATDIAQRGLDIDGISHVVNYNVPLDPEDYTHRIGRTGRAGAEGSAITFVTAEDLGAFKTLQYRIGRDLERIHHPDFDFAGGVVKEKAPQTKSRSGKGMGSKHGKELSPEDLAALLSHDK